jgi:hypothetical protein
LIEAIRYMASGRSWQALEVEKGPSRRLIVVEHHEVKAGEGLLDLIKTVPKYAGLLPFSTSIAGARETSSLAVPTVDWERAVRLNGSVVKCKNVVRSTRKNFTWTVGQGMAGHSFARGKHCNILLPTVMEIDQAIQLGSCMGSWMERDVDNVRVCLTMDIMTNVLPEDPRRQRLLSVQARRTEEDGIEVRRYGDHVKMEFDGVNGVWCGEVTGFFEVLSPNPGAFERGVFLAVSWITPEQSQSEDGFVHYRASVDSIDGLPPRVVPVECVTALAHIFHDCIGEPRCMVENSVMRHNAANSKWLEPHPWGVPGSADR